MKLFAVIDNTRMSSLNPKHEELASLYDYAEPMGMPLRY